MPKSSSCWTCRLRRKKCDQEQPTCRECSALSIQCHYRAERPDWMDGGQAQDEMARRLKSQVKQGKERRRERGYVQVINMGVVPKSKNESTRLEVNAHNHGHVEDSTSSPTSDEYESFMLEWKSDVIIPNGKVFKELDVDFTMLYLDHVFPFLFPFYNPPMIQGGRAWLLDTLRSNKTLFQAVMSLSAFFFTLVLSSEDVSGHERCRRNTWNRLVIYADAAIKSLREEVLAIDKQSSKVDLLQQARAMESVMQLMVLETAMAKPAELSIHLAAATSLLEGILESSKLDGYIGINGVISRLERPSWATAMMKDRPIWNNDQAAFLFFLAILVWADILSCTSLKMAPRLQKHYPSLLCYQPGGVSLEPILPMEEYVGCEGWALLAIADTAALDVWKRQTKEEGSLAAKDLTSWGEQVHKALQDGLERLDKRSRKPARQRQGILHSFYHSSDTNQTAKQLAATRIWAHAARIYLMVVTCGWQPQHPTIRESVSRVLHLFQEVQSPEILRGSAWPFCVAGCLAEASREQEFRDLATASGPLQSFGLVGEALRILELVWSRRGELSVDWDLAACFNVTGAPVLLL